MGLLRGREGWQQKQFEKQSGFKLKIKPYPKESEWSSYVKLVGPQDVLDYWAPWLIETFAV